MNLNGVLRKQKKTSTDGNSLLCILYSSNVLQPGNFISLINGTVMPAKMLENLHKIRNGGLQEDASSSKLGGIEDATKDSLRT